MAIFNTVPPLAAGTGLAFDGETISLAVDISDKQDKALKFTNISVPASAWKTAAASSCDGVRTKYANVTLSGVTADMVPQVVFPPVHIESFNLSPIVRTIDGGIQIYAETAPTGAITIPTILCWR